MAVARDLISRRLPHILGAYLAGSWILIEFLTWAVSRYVLSPHLIDLALTLLVLLTPSVAIIAYFHGTPGRDQSPRVEKVAVGANLATAAVVSLLLFGGRDLGRATTTVIVEDEDGISTGRLMPKDEFRHGLAVFPFENASGDSALVWLEYGIPTILSFDLDEDAFLWARSDFERELHQMGFSDGGSAPLPLKLQIAAEQGFDYVVTGTFAREAEELSAEVMLHEAATARRVAMHASASGQVAGLVDSITARLRRDVDLPEGHLRTARDLPVSDLLTSSDAALRHYVEGTRLSVDAGRAEQFAKAVEEDPTFARAHWLLYRALRAMGRGDAAVPSLEAAMQHNYRLPERRRYATRIEHYLVVEQDSEAALAVARAWTQHFPEYGTAYEALARLYRNNGQGREAIATYEQILEFDPTFYRVLLYIANVYEELNDFDRALEYREVYAGRFPQEPAALISLSRGYRLVGGREEEARSACEQVLLLDPENLEAQECLARVEGVEPDR